MEKYFLQFLKQFSSLSNCHTSLRTRLQCLCVIYFFKKSIFSQEENMYQGSTFLFAQNCCKYFPKHLGMFFKQLYVKFCYFKLIFVQMGTYSTWVVGTRYRTYFSLCFTSFVYCMIIKIFARQHFTRVFYTPLRFLFILTLSFVHFLLKVVGNEK
jgi:hypothetical protein